MLGEEPPGFLPTPGRQNTNGAPRQENDKEPDGISVSSSFPRPSPDTRTLSYKEEEKAIPSRNLWMFNVIL
ncbi:unnamed protein product [Caretta caretta]